MSLIPDPHEIRRANGDPVYLCAACRQDVPMYWWRGMSVPMCHDPACEQRWSARCKAEQEAQDNYDEYVRENWG